MNSLTLNDIAEIVMGQSPKGEDCNRDPSGTPLLNGPTEFGPKFPVAVQFTTDPKRFSKIGDILFCVRGSTTGRMNFADRPYAIGRGIAAIRGKNGYPTAFVKGIIDSTLSSLLVQATGSTFPNVSREMLYNLKIPFVDAGTAKAIAKILSAFDDKIELNRRINATLEAMARALFKAWFVDFEPVHANQQNRPSTSASPEIAKLFPSTFENNIPKGWRVGKLGDVLEAKGGTTPSTKNSAFWDGDNFWATPKDLSNLRFPVLLKTERRITDDGVRRISSGVLPIGTLLLSSRAPIGYLAVSQVPISINQGFIAIQGKEVSNLFMLFWLKENMESVKSRANGSTFQEISKSSFREVEITVPSNSLRGKFNEVAEPMFEKIVANEVESYSLAEIRDSLLPRLISGKIRVDL